MRVTGVVEILERLGLALEPAQDELIAHPAQRLGLRAGGLVGSDQLVAERARAGHEAGEAELAREGEIDLGLRGEAERARRLAEAQALVALRREHALDVLGVEAEHQAERVGAARRGLSHRRDEIELHA